MTARSVPAGRDGRCARHPNEKPGHGPSDGNGDGNGDGKTDGPIPQRVFWCTFEGLIAIALLLGGGLKALQSMVVTTGLPFTFVLLLMCVSIVLGLRSERALLKAEKARGIEGVGAAESTLRHPTGSARN